MSVIIQTFNRVGWPENSPILLTEGAAAAILTAARDYQAETGHDLHGDYLVAPLGGLRTIPQVEEMQHGFDLHKAGAAGWQAIYEKYNMDTRSTARPSLGTHPTGNCADISNAGFRAWLKAGNAARYGIKFTLGTADPDHCQFFPGTNTAALDVTGLDNTITQAQRYWRNTMSEGFARGDSDTIITLPDKSQFPASYLVYAINYGTGTRRYEKHDGVVLNWLAVVGLSAVPQLTQAQLDGIPKTPGSIDWDGHTVGADGK